MKPSMPKLSNLRFAVAPVAAALLPVVYLYSYNVERVPFASAVRTLAVVFACAVIVYMLLSRVVPGPGKAAVVQTAFTALFFLFGYFMRYDQPVSQWKLGVEWALFGLYCFYTLAAVLAAVVIMRAKRDLSTVATVASIVAASILAVPAVQAAYYEAFVRKPVERQQAPPVGEPAMPGPRPDIYYIVLDGYARHDVLDAIYGVDNAPFLTALGERGFRVAPNGRSNYLETSLSLGSSLNLAYLDEVARREGDSTSRRPLVKLIQASEVARVVRSQGYRFVNVDSGCYLTAPNPNADLELTRRSISNAEFENAVFRMTPLARIPWLDAGFALWATGERDRIHFQFEALSKLPDQGGPTFVMAHIMSPHPPFVFGADGGSPRYKFPISGNDGNVFDGARDHRYVACYGDQLRYLNGMVLQAIDTILARYPSGERPIIILQGDHGSGLHFDLADKDQTNLWERSSILSAFLLPEHVAFETYDGMTPVNTFRVVFNGLWGTRYELLEDRTFYAPFRHPYRHTEVSAAEIEADRADIVERASAR
jgi:hypothetical protein